MLQVTRAVLKQAMHVRFATSLNRANGRNMPKRGVFGNSDRVFATATRRREW